MKTAISLSDALFKKADAAAKRLGVSRSKFMQMAIETQLRSIRDKGVTAALDRSHTASPEADDPFLDRATRQTMKRMEQDDAAGRDLVGRSRRTKRIGTRLPKTSAHRLSK